MISVQVTFELGLQDTRGFAQPRRGEDISVGAEGMASLTRAGVKFSLGALRMGLGSHGRF